jgi:hypothetical protein
MTEPATDIFASDPATTPPFGVGDKVWVFRNGMYPMRGVVAEIRALGLNDSHRVTLENKTYDGGTYATWEIYARPSGKAELLAKLVEEIEFIQSCAQELRDEEDEDDTNDQ